MNDRELDELLDKWNAPVVPMSLCSGVRDGFGARRGRRGMRWWGKGLIAAAAVVVLFVLVPKAEPQKGRLGMLFEVRHPYSVLSEFVRYGKDGSARIEMYSTEYNDQEGREHLLARRIPDNPVHDTVARIVDAASDATGPLRLYLLRLSPVNAEIMDKRAAFFRGVITECVGEACITFAHYGLGSAGHPSTGCVEGAAAERETILDYATVATQLPVDGNKMRRTVWMAPALSCFALKVETEKEQADGSFRLVSSKQAIKVRLNP
jgi:hypothetical protein